MSTKAQQKPTAKGPLKPKNMSSRLLTMKFMQRGVSASSTSSSGKSKDSKDGSNSITDRKAEKAALAAAIAEEERIKAEAARKRQEIVGVREDEETPWELAVIGVKDQGLNVKVMGHGELVEGEEDEDEEDDDSEEEEVGCGRFSFGQFNKMVDVRFARHIPNIQLSANKQYRNSMVWLNPQTLRRKRMRNQRQKKPVSKGLHKSPVVLISKLVNVNNSAQLQTQNALIATK